MKILKIFKRLKDHLIYRKRQISSKLNSYLIKLEGPRFRTFQNKYKNKLKNHFYIIVTPNTLHLLEPCLKLIPKNINVFLIFNGLKSWEEKYFKKKYSNYPIFKLITIPWTYNLHGVVLSLLLKNNKSNFGIIDHDCYILDKSIFKKLKFKEKEIIIYIRDFCNINEKTNLIFPRTHFMFFNTVLINKIMSKYGISAEQYKKNPSFLEFKKIPLHLEKKLLTLNLGEHNFPKTHLNFFDTLHMICSMALYEKFSFKGLNIKKNDILHIGYASFRDFYNNPSFSCYCTLKILENSKNKLFKRKYLPLFLKYNNSDYLLNLISKTKNPKLLKKIKHFNKLYKRIII